MFLEFALTVRQLGAAVIGACLPLWLFGAPHMLTIFGAAVAIYVVGIGLHIAALGEKR